MKAKFKKHFMPIVAVLLGVAFIGFCVYATILGFMQHEVGIALVLMVSAMCTTWFTA